MKVLWALVFIAFGLGFYLLDGPSYISNDPRACIHCHVMDHQYEGWVRSTHANVAVCNDCHTSGNGANRLIQKAEYGVLHSWALLTKSYADPIRLKSSSAQIVQASCRQCHRNFLEKTLTAQHRDPDAQCLACHRVHL